MNSIEKINASFGYVYKSLVRWIRVVLPILEETNLALQGRVSIIQTLCGSSKLIILSVFPVFIIKFVVVVASL